MAEKSNATIEYYDSLTEIVRMVRNAHIIMQDIQEDYFLCYNNNDLSNASAILCEFDRNAARADVVSDIICNILKFCEDKGFKAP